jgi:CPA2 family monovalent cation:H+ antiporter-2
MREVLASLFFISVGMLLDPLAVMRDPLPVLGILVLILSVKFLVITGVALALRLPLRVALISGMILAQTGEFLFVLARAAEGTGLVDTGIQGHLMTAAILSMLVTPLLMYASPHVAAGLSSFGVLHRYLGIRSVVEEGRPSARTDHVIIAGHGVAGAELSAALRGRDIDYAIVELNAETVRTLLAQDEPAYFGDVTNPEVLEKLGIHHARELVITINDPDAARRAVTAARGIAPELPILVRVRYVAEVEALLEAGATRVVPSEFESAVEIVSQVLEGHGVDGDEIRAHVERMHGRCKVKRASIEADLNTSADDDRLEGERDKS